MLGTGTHTHTQIHGYADLCKDRHLDTHRQTEYMYLHKDKQAQVYMDTPRQRDTGIWTQVHRQTWDMETQTWMHAQPDKGTYTSTQTDTWTQTHRHTNRHRQRQTWTHAEIQTQRQAH